MRYTAQSAAVSAAGGRVYARPAISRVSFARRALQRMAAAHCCAVQRRCATNLNAWLPELAAADQQEFNRIYQQRVKDWRS